MSTASLVPVANQPAQGGFFAVGGQLALEIYPALIVQSFPQWIGLLREGAELIDASGQLVQPALDGEPGCVIGAVRIHRLKRRAFDADADGLLEQSSARRRVT